MYQVLNEQKTSQSNEFQDAVTAFIDRWLEIKGVPVKRRHEAIGVADRTYNRLKSGDRKLRSDQMVELAEAIGIAPYYLSIPGSLSLADHQMKTAIIEAARYQLAIAQMFTLPPEERTILFRSIHNLVEAAAIKQRDLMARGDF